MRRGEVWLINLDPTVGAEIQKTRPAIIVNDDGVGVLSRSNKSISKSPNAYETVAGFAAAAT